jgi:hypothetical protein
MNVNEYPQVVQSALVSNPNAIITNNGVEIPSSLKDSPNELIVSYIGLFDYLSTSAHNDVAVQEAAVQEAVVQEAVVQEAVVQEAVVQEASTEPVKRKYTKKSEE